MKLSEVSKQDGLHMIHILKALNIARFDGVTGEDMDKLSQAKKWLAELAREMGTSLQVTETVVKSPIESNTFKIKNMGPIGSPQVNNKKSRKKK